MCKLLQNVPIYDEVPLSIKKSDLSEVTSKHKNLFKMRTESGTELLLKAETEQAMQHWVQVCVILDMLLIYIILIWPFNIREITNTRI